MISTIQSLSHSKYDCKYHIVFIPKRRKKVIFINQRKQLGQIFHELAKQKECIILEGSTMSDHVHLCITIPPKYSVSSVIGFIKGKSAIAMARLNGRKRNFTGESFWARGILGINSRLRFRTSQKVYQGTKRRLVIINL